MDEKGLFWPSFFSAPIDKDTATIYFEEMSEFFYVIATLSNRKLQLRKHLLEVFFCPIATIVGWNL